MNNINNEMNLNINQINNSMDQSQDNPKHSLTRNHSMNNINTSHFYNFSFDKF